MRLVGKDVVGASPLQASLVQGFKRLRAERDLPCGAPFGIPFGTHLPGTFAAVEGSPLHYRAKAKEVTEDAGRVNVNFDATATAASPRQAHNGTQGNSA